jgi:hypothetical protein
MSVINLDVYLGRGGGMNKKRHGSLYQILIKRHFEEYRNVKNEEKREFALKHIICPIESAGGKFFFYQREGGCMEASQKQKVDTVMQALRDGGKTPKPLPRRLCGPKLSPETTGVVLAPTEEQEATCGEAIVEASGLSAQFEDAMLRKEEYTMGYENNNHEYGEDNKNSNENQNYYDNNNNNNQGKNDDNSCTQWSVDNAMPPRMTIKLLQQCVQQFEGLVNVLSRENALLRQALFEQEGVVKQS